MKKDASSDIFGRAMFCLNTRLAQSIRNSKDGLLVHKIREEQWILGASLVCQTATVQITFHNYFTCLSKRKKRVTEVAAADIKYCF